MKINAEILNERHEVEITREGEKVLARVDDRIYELEASEVERDVFLLKHNNQIHQIYVAPSGLVNIGNHQIDIKLVDPRKLRNSGDSEASLEGKVEIKTAMPGKIVRILVEDGAEVKHGDGVIVVEAMKMQNEMKSPKDGVIKLIRVKVGDTVNAGEVLLVIE